MKYCQHCSELLLVVCFFTFRRSQNCFVFAEFSQESFRVVNEGIYAKITYFCMFGAFRGCESWKFVFMESKLLGSERSLTFYCWHVGTHTDI